MTVTMVLMMIMVNGDDYDGDDYDDNDDEDDEIPDEEFLSCHSSTCEKASVADSETSGACTHLPYIKLKFKKIILIYIKFILNLY